MMTTTKLINKYFKIKKYILNIISVNCSKKKTVREFCQAIFAYFKLAE